jgi:hypothetical protein
VNSIQTLAVLALLVSAVFVAGCGNEALRINAEVARGMLELQAESGPRIRELRIAAGVSAGREAMEAGLQQDRAQAAARAAAEQWQCAIDGHSIYAEAVGSYIDTLTLWQAGRDFDISDILPFVRRAIDSYRFLSSCLSSLGSDVLPELPSFFNLIPPTWGIQ